MHEMGLGWHNPVGTGNAEFTSTNGIEGSWTSHPTRWDNEYLQNLFAYDWTPTKSPAGALQWTPKEADARMTPDAHIVGKDNPLMMMTSDIALKEDPVYREICQRFLNDFDYFSDAFSRAWYKLTHRDMGPIERYVGPEVPAELLPWQDPIPTLDHPVVDDADVAKLKAMVLDSGMSTAQLVAAAWASASTYRDTDKRGGANGARVALSPQIDWQVNSPATLRQTLDGLRSIQQSFNGDQSGDKRISLADMIVLGGCAAVERAAQKSGVEIEVPFVPGRMDTTQELTDGESFEWLRPVVDGFRNFIDGGVTLQIDPEHVFLDRAAMLSLSAPQWTALAGGLKTIGINADGSRDGCFTDDRESLSNDFFEVVTSMDYVWKSSDDADGRFDLVRRDDGAEAFTATRCDLIFGVNAQLRGIAEVYASSDGHRRFVQDFVAAWHKVMMLDRFDVPEARAAAFEAAARG